MMGLSTIIILLLELFVRKILTLEKYTLLPISSEYCKIHSSSSLFNLDKHIKINSGIYDNLNRDITNICHVRIAPIGKLVPGNGNDFQTSFWHLRFRVMFEDCNSVLEIEYKPDSFQNLESKMERVSCNNQMPYIVDADHRYVIFKLHLSNSHTSSNVSIDMATYLRYHTDYSISKRIEICNSYGGLWCGNQTLVCLNESMGCDDGDGCFNGGTDEMNCSTKTIPNESPKKLVESESSYVPWTATLLVLIPLLVILILRLLTVQRRSFGDLDSYSQNDFNPNFMNDETNGKEDKGSTTQDQERFDKNPFNNDWSNNDPDGGFCSKQGLCELQTTPCEDELSSKCLIEDPIRKFNEHDNYSKKSPLLNRDHTETSTPESNWKHLNYQKSEDFIHQSGYKRVSDDSTISKGESGFFTDSSSSGINNFNSRPLKQFSLPKNPNTCSDSILNV